MHPAEDRPCQAEDRLEEDHRNHPEEDRRAPDHPAEDRRSRLAEDHRAGDRRSRRDLAEGRPQAVRLEQHLEALRKVRLAGRRTG